MDAPIILVMSREAETLEVVGGEVRKRYGGDYRVALSATHEQAWRVLQQAADEDTPVALALGTGAAERDAAGLFTRVRTLHATAKRAAIVLWGTSAARARCSARSPAATSTPT